MSPCTLEPRKLLLVADTDGNWYVRRVKWTIDDARRGLMIYECDESIGAAFEFAEQGLSALRRALREQKQKRPEHGRRSTKRLTEIEKALKLKPGSLWEAAGLCRHCGGSGLSAALEAAKEPKR